MKTLRDLQLFNILHDLPEFKEAARIFGDSTATILFDFVCANHKNIAFQSAAMQLGLKVYDGRDSMLAFDTGADILVSCKDMGIYALKSNGKSIWIQPIMQFESDEMYLLDEINFETHELPDVVNSNEGIILSKFSKHTKPLNYLFLNKINKIPLELDMDILLNFSGENMPINYNKVTAEYLNKPIHFKWDYDSRGRSYSCGYGINIQGNKTVRSVLSLSNKEVINDIDPLFIALANARGFDHWTWKRRIDWALKQPINNDINIPKDTKYPEKYVKTIRALLDCAEMIPSGFMMELDATASGIQIMGCIMGCEKTANEVNLIDPTKRKDVYGTMARKMGKVTGEIYSRDDVKYPVMTHYYNSLALPKSVFAEEELPAFYECLDGLLPGAEKCMEMLNRCWNPRAKYHSWVLPDGHTAFVRTMTLKEGQYVYDGTKISYQYYVNEGNVTSFRSLVPNIIHSIDGYIARQMILRAPFEMLHVHDCFLFHPNHYKEVMELYRTLLAELVVDYNINHIIKSLTGSLRSQYYVDSSLADKVMRSNYALS